jgi:glucokinase
VNLPECAIGVDLGGQSVKLGLVDQAGVILLRGQAAIDSTRPVEEVSELLIEQIEQLLVQSRRKGLAPSAVGVVMPGYMDVGRTRLIFAANLPTLNGTDFLARIKAGVDLPVAFDADCNAAAFGEYHFGAGRGVERLIVVTVGTGIGGAVMIQGRILRLWNHISGSLGHVTVDARGPKCRCGGHGCVEAHASGPVLERLAAEGAAAEPESKLARLAAASGKLTGLEIRQALDEGDPVALRAVNECGWWLGAGVAAWSVIYAPQKVLFGGGILGLGEPLLEAIRTGLREVGQPHTTGKIEIGAAALGNDAGVIGAAAMVMADQLDHKFD